MKPFTKLFSSLTSSSIWRAPDNVRLVWITMLAACDKDGEVWASVGGLADLARVSRAQCLDALLVLSSPDEDSRTRENEGRRIVVIDGGWRLLNYKKYRELGRSEDRREYFAEHKRKSRAVHNSPHESTSCPHESTSCPPMSPIAEAEAEAEAEAKAEKKEAPADLSIWVRWSCSDQERKRENRAKLDGLLRHYGFAVVSKAAEALSFTLHRHIWPDELGAAILAERGRAPPAPSLTDRTPDSIRLTRKPKSCPTPIATPEKTPTLPLSAPSSASSSTDQTPPAGPPSPT